MLYNFNASGYNPITPGLKKLMVDAGLESLLIPGTSITLISDPYVMYGNIVSYNQTKLIVDVGKTNTKEQNLFSEKWNIEVEGDFKKPIPTETQAQVENPYTPPVTPYTPPVTPYTPSSGIASYEEPFYIKYKVPLLVLIVALIIGLIYFFLNKSGTYSANNFIAAFGEIL
jgi:hypothetical protein